MSDASKPPEIKLAETLPRLVAAKNFKGKRKKLASEIGVGQGALSQYERGVALPSLHVAVRLANALGVSMDELLFGTMSEAPKTFDVAPFFRTFDNTLSDIQSRVTQHSWLMSEIGSLVASRIDRAAERLLKAELQRIATGSGDADAPLLRLPTSRLPGIISDKTTHTLEEHSLGSHVATTNFFYEIQIIEGQKIPGGFLPTMVANLRRGRWYNFLYSPGTPDAESKIAHMRDFFSDALGSPQRMGELFKVRRARKPFAIGFCMYEMDVQGLGGSEPAFLKTLGQFLDDKKRLGYVIPPNRLVQGDVLVEVDRMADFSNYVKQTWDDAQEI